MVEGPAEDPCAVKFVTFEGSAVCRIALPIHRSLLMPLMAVDVCGVELLKLQKTNSTSTSSEVQCKLSNKPNKRTVEL